MKTESRINVSFFNCNEIEGLPTERVLSKRKIIMKIGASVQDLYMDIQIIINMETNCITSFARSQLMNRYTTIQYFVYWI